MESTSVVRQPWPAQNVGSSCRLTPGHTGATQEPRRSHAGGSPPASSELFPAMPTECYMPPGGGPLCSGARRGNMIPRHHQRAKLPDTISRRPTILSDGHSLLLSPLPPPISRLMFFIYPPVRRDAARTRNIREIDY